MMLLALFGRAVPGFASTTGNVSGSRSFSPTRTPSRSRPPGGIYQRVVTAYRDHKTTIEAITSALSAFVKNGGQVRWPRHFHPVDY